MRNVSALRLLLAVTCYVLAAGPGISADVSLSQFVKSGSKYPVFWPPRIGVKFPDLHLIESSGRAINLSKFEGKVILVEEIGMSCPACNAFCGAARSGGGFRGTTPETGLVAMDDYLRRQGIDPNNADLVVVDLLLYDMRLQSPTAQDAKEWCRHFKIPEGGNHIVAVGDKSLICQASYDLIPGFQLIDRSFTLCGDSTGHNPKEDLWRSLVPKLKAML